jgi:transcriptional antiterminator RfaH
MELVSMTWKIPLFMVPASQTPTGCPADLKEKSAPDELFWFCLRTQPHRELFAHTSLKKLEKVESFFPRIRFLGTGRRQGRWITEALFPGYLFCKFNLRDQTRAVSYSPGVSGLIHFGNHCPTVPSEVIQQLQATFGPDEVTTVEQPLKIGDRVLIESGPMRGLEGIVCRVLPGKTRVALLLEFLGQQTQIEIDVSQAQAPRDRRSALA